MEVLKNVTGIKVEIKPGKKAHLLERESPMSVKALTSLGLFQGCQKH